VIGIGENILDDDETALLVGIGQTIGRRKRPARGIRMDIFDMADRIGAFEGRPSGTRDGDLHFADLCLVDTAIHGFGHHALGQ